MLEVNDVTFKYSAEEGVPPALCEVNLRIDAGETVAIIGHNGSGKSTMAKLIAAILRPTSGKVLVDGLNTASHGEDLWTIRQRVGIVFQNPDDQLVANTVIDEIAFGPENLGLPRFEIEERVQEAMALLELESYAQMAVSELSVGQKQRVAIAGILAMHPRYLLLDEPTTMISGHTARQLLETVRRLASERGITVIHITHFMHEVSTFSRVIVMDEGRVLMDDTPANVFARADELRAVGLDVPMVTSLGEHLRAQGWVGLPEVVLSNEQLKISSLDGTGNVGVPLAGELAGGKIKGTRSYARDNPIPERGQAPPLDLDPSRAGASPISTNAWDSRAGASPAPTLYGDHPIPLFEMRNLSHTYLRDTPFAVQALNGLSLTILEGQTTALVGPTKAGKSTVVDVLAGLIKPAAGTFFFGGDDVGASSFDIEGIRSIVGVVFQSPDAQIFEDTVGKDVSFGPRRKKVPVAESRRLVQESLEAVGLLYEDFRSRYTYALSGGQKRRVAIAGVLALQPKVIIFDEPTAGLDPRGRRELLELIVQLKQRHGLTIIYTSSGLDDVIGLADTIHVLDQGHTVLSGEPREILQHADQLAALDIALPEAAQIALSLHEMIPTVRTDVLNLEELEAEIMNVRIAR
jgi:energy-coupling factor transporter ATPase